MGAAVALALSLGPPSLAAADTITVTTSLDTSGSQCTLRDAITAANTAASTGQCAYAPGGTQADPDTINFNLPSLPATINLATALPQVLYPLTITGPGASQLDVHRSSGSNFRILSINPNGLDDTDVVSGLTLSNGNLVDSIGAGIVTRDADLTLDHMVVSGNSITSSASPTKGDQGAGIFNNVDGVLHLVDSTVRDNHIAVNVAGFLGAGAGIYNDGTMTVTDSTISGDDITSTAAGSGQAFALGGGIFTSDATTISRSTISGNTASATSGSSIATSAGGGLLSSGPSLTLRLSTVGGNVVSSTTTSTPAAGGGLALNGGGAVLTGDTIAFNTGALSGNLSSEANPPNSATVRDTIISNPVGPNCSFDAGGSLTSGGYNLEDDATGSCLFDASHDLALGTHPLLDPTLALNGGPTQNYALQAGSPAIEAGSAFGETTDQRALPRPSDDLAVPTAPGGDGSDIGAFETQGQPFAGAPPSPTLSPTAPAPKKCKKKKHGHKASAAKKKCKKKRK